jgi:hypothetical protein
VNERSTFDRVEDALDSAQADRPALVLPEPRREAADEGERGDGDHLPPERGEDEELHPQDGRAVEVVWVGPELRQPRRPVLLQLGRQRQARHREQLQRPLFPPLKTTAMRRQPLHQTLENRNDIDNGKSRATLHRLSVAPRTDPSKSPRRTPSSRRTGTSRWSAKHHTVNSSGQQERSNFFRKKNVNATKKGK